MEFRRVLFRSLCLHPSGAHEGRYLGRGGKPPGGGAQPAQGCRPFREKLQGVPARVAGQGVAQAGDGDLARALYSVPAVYDTYRYICSAQAARKAKPRMQRSEEHTSELQSLMRTSYAVFCLKKKKKTKS